MDVHSVLLASLVTVSDYLLVFVVLFIEVMVVTSADMIRVFRHLGIQTSDADFILGEYGHDVLRGERE